MFVTYSSLRKDLTIAVAAALLISIFSWSAGLRFLQTAHAADLSSVSDTLSDSRPSFGANHTIQYTNSTTTNAGESVQVTFDPTTNAFGGVGNVTLGDVTSTGMTVVSACGAGSDEVTLSTSTSALTFTVCSGEQLATGTKTIQVNNDVITNPTSTGSYIIRIAAGVNSADTRVAIVNAVQVTASVNTTFSFTIGGLPTSTLLGNGATTTGSSATTSLDFGTINPNTPYELGQQLTVTTNAGNGFAVTVHEDQDMTSANGNTIHLFYDGDATSTPIQWAPPGNVLDQPNTYGHIGITSDDADLGGGEFGTSTPLYVGDFQPTSTLTIFSHNGPADGVTQNKGAAKVAYRLEVSPLQPAANDYTNNLIYVATPVF